MSKDDEPRVTMTLQYILRHCTDWEKFCAEFGVSEWAVNEGGGDIEKSLTLTEARQHGLLGEF